MKVKWSVIDCLIEVLLKFSFVNACEWVCEQFCQYREGTYVTQYALALLND